jgi:glycosyltransferase involved in cell wall biosynthesis
MRILHTVELYDPSVGGAQEVVRQISTRLAARGHEVTVATSRLAERHAHEIDGVHVREFAVSGNAVRGMRGEVDAYRDFVLGGDFDVMMSYAAQQWTVDALLDVLPLIPRPHAIAPCGFSGLHDPAYADYFRELPVRLRDCAALIFHSDSYQDIELARAHGLERLAVIPNGADEREFGDLDALDGHARDLRERYGLAADTPVLLTVGGHTGQKGHALAIAALRRLSASRAALIVAANDPLGIGCRYSCPARAASVTMLTRGRKRVLLLRVPRGDVVAAYRAADLFVFGSAIECSPLVLFEAMAAGTPFLTLHVGNAAEIARWSGGAGRVLPTTRLARGRVGGAAGDMAAEAGQLLADPAERTRMGEAGRHAWEERFTWAAIVARYEALYEQLLRGELPADPSPPTAQHASSRRSPL